MYYILCDYITQCKCQLNKGKYQYLHPGKAKVDDFDLICDSAHTENVFWLKFVSKQIKNVSNLLIFTKKCAEKKKQFWQFGWLCYL